MYTTAMIACARAGDGNSCVSLFNSMKNANIQPTVRSYNALLFSKAKNATLRTSRRQRSHVSFRSSRFVHLDSCETAGDTLATYSGMVRENLQPNAFTFASLITAYCRHGRADLAENVVEFDAPAAGVLRDWRMYFAFVEVLVEKGGPYFSLDAAFSKLEQMKSAGVRSASAPFALVMKGFINEGAYEKALDTYKLMLDAGTAPCGVTQDLYITAKALSGDVSTALQSRKQQQQQQQQQQAAQATAETSTQAAANGREATGATTVGG